MNATMQRISNAVTQASDARTPGNRSIGHRYGYQVIRTGDGTVQACYRGTVVAAFSPDFAKVVLTTRGWRTTTTKRVMNAALDGTRYEVCQRRFEWYVGRRDELGNWTEQPFEEGMTLDLAPGHCPDPRHE